MLRGDSFPFYPLTIRMWAIYQNKVYDLSDYFYTVQFYSGSSGRSLPTYDFFNSGIKNLFQTQPGQDITNAMNQVLSSMTLMSR